MPDVGKLEILEINNDEGEGGHCIHDMVHYDTYRRDKTGGSILRTVEQAVAQGQGKITFLDVNPAFFWAVLDYLIKQKYHIS